MVTAGDSGPNYAQRLGIHKDQVVQELGWDEDTDDDIRADVEDASGAELLDEDADEVVDVVLLWWRDGDGDLVDRLMDAITPLADDGIIWVLTPKTGKPGHVLPAEIAESAPTAGLMQTSSANLGTGAPADWSNRNPKRPGGIRDPDGRQPGADFTLKDQNGQPVTLSDYRGKKNVLLVFFPLAFTGICQGELDEVRDHLPDYENDDTVTMAISVGPPPTHKIWATERIHLPGAVGLLAARSRRAGLRRVQRRRRLSQPGHLRRRPFRCDPVRRDERARRSPQPDVVDRSPGGPEGLTGISPHRPSVGNLPGTGA